MCNYFIILSNLDKKNAERKYVIEEIDLFDRPSFKRREILDKEKLIIGEYVFFENEKYKFRGYKCSTTTNLLNTLPTTFKRPRSARRNRTLNQNKKDVTCMIVLQKIHVKNHNIEVDIFSTEDIIAFRDIDEENINKGDKIMMGVQLYRVEGFRLDDSETILDKLPDNYKRPKSTMRSRPGISHERLSPARSMTPKKNYLLSTSSIMNNNNNNNFKKFRFMLKNYGTHNRRSPGMNRPKGFFTQKFLNKLRISKLKGTTI